MIYLYMRGNYLVVEKVKPDPLNLLVKTGVGKRSRACIQAGRFPKQERPVFLYK